MRFEDYSEEKEKWITFVENEFYPDYLEDAKRKYFEIFKLFHEHLHRAGNSAELLRLIMAEKGKLRIQLLRVFRKFVSPDTSVEMLKVKSRTETIIEEFGSRFRDINDARKKFRIDNGALAAILHEYEDRGQKGYELSSIFFTWFREKFNQKNYNIIGPERAGKDIYLNKVLKGFSSPRPVDFVIYHQDSVIAIGLIRYDSDRGGSQEDDRTSGYRGLIREILSYSERQGFPIKMILINEGPGLCLGSMWKDYSILEKMGKGQVIVVTLKMLDDRFTEEWLLSDETN